ncbi:Nucleolar protein 10, partial [Gonapodya sp. JEL0774]
PDHRVTDMCVFDDTSGLVLVATESQYVETFYVPELGPAPRWCAFLENLTEEMEGGAGGDASAADGVGYSDYKFVTRAELSQLGMDHLIGTPTLRAYMHGFFVDLRLYRRARAIAQPFAFEEWKKKEVDKRVEEERRTRISRVGKKGLPKVNKKMAERMAREESKAAAKKGAAGATAPASAADGTDGTDGVPPPTDTAKFATPLTDPRFASLWKDPEFEVDEVSNEYLLHHPEAREGGGVAGGGRGGKGVKGGKRERSSDEESGSEIESGSESGGEGGTGSDGDGDGDSDSTDSDTPDAAKAKPPRGTTGASDITRSTPVARIHVPAHHNPAAPPARPRLRPTPSHPSTTTQSRSLPLAARLAEHRSHARGAGNSSSVTRGAGGARSVTFVPRGRGRGGGSGGGGGGGRGGQWDGDGDGGRERKERRGVRALRLSSGGRGRGGFRGGGRGRGRGRG